MSPSIHRKNTIRHSYDSVHASRAKLLSSLMVIAVAVAIYSQTAFRTITWWGNADYSLAAVILGISAPPGSLLLTLLGWVVTKLPLGVSDIFSLNLFAGVLAGITSGLVCFIAMNLIRSTKFAGMIAPYKGSSIAVLIGAAFGSLNLAFSETLWLYAIKFTPYVLTALFTAMIIWAMIRWWERADQVETFRWLFLIAFFFGLDFSVHRTNFLLVPGLFFWILLRRLKTIVSIQSWLSGICGLIAGLLLHLLLIPMASREPYLNISNPDSLTRFWHYVSLKQFGGGFLVSFFSRKADFFNEQVMDWVNAFIANFLFSSGGLGVFGVLPAALGLLGLLLLWRRNRKLAGGLIALFLLTSVTTIIYFNIPANFFRSLHRHYLPCFVIFSVFITYGAGSILQITWNLRKKYRLPATGLVGLLIIASPTHQIVRNYNRIDGSNNYFTYDTSMNIFNTLPADAILFTSGDNDTFPLWYLQAAEGMRPDITICNLGLMNTPWFIDQVIKRDSTFPLGLSQEEISQLRILPWKDTTIVVPVQSNPETFQLQKDMVLPDSLYLEVKPTISGGYLMVQDQLLIQIISNNQWKRPMYFMSAPEWLRPYLRYDGMSQRLIPQPSPPLNKELLRKNLLERYIYRCYADPTVPLEQPSKWMAFNLYRGFVLLAHDEMESGSDSECKYIKQKMLELLPPNRLEPPPQIRKAIDELCKNIGGEIPE